MRFRIQRFLCHHLKISNQEAFALMKEKRILINGKSAIPNQLVSHRDTVVADNHELQKGRQYLYYALHKPTGIECTTNPEIPDNILPYFPVPDLFLVGRLDKASEGLIFITDDDFFYNAIAHSNSHCEKEYYVETDKPISDEDLQALASGVRVLGQLTRPCQTFREHSNGFRIILTQGLNRQIRRMCHKRGLQVTLLRRVRIGKMVLGDLSSGSLRPLSEAEVEYFIP